MNDRRHASLDSLRALAIVLVITAHTVTSYGSPASLAPLRMGGTGVDLFFVLSGWLLGKQLASELRDTGSIDVRRFWIRRWLRTLPAYYFVLFFTYLQQLLKGNSDLHYSYLAFLQNYSDSLPYFAVSWSLCVEEHFYLFIAPFLLVIHRLGKWRWIILAILIFLPSLFRALGWYGSAEETHVRWDACLTGVLLAMAQSQKGALWESLAKLAPLGFAVALVIYLLNFADRWNLAIGIPGLGHGGYAILFGCFVLFAVSSPGVQKTFYFPGANYIALRAYSLYLLHPEILALLRRFAAEVPFEVYYTLAWIGSLAISEVLYRLVERPGMQLREKLPWSKSGIHAG